MRKKPKGYFLYPSIYAKSKVAISPKKLEAIFFIKKSKRNKVERLSLKESFKESIVHCRSVFYGYDIVKIYDRLLSVLKAVPSYRLHFKKDPSFWKLIK